MNKIFKEIEAEVNLMYNDKHRKEVIDNINNLVNYLNGVKIGDIPVKQFQSYTADELTRIGGKLAIYQYNLIEYELECFRNKKRAELDIDINRSNIRKTLISESTKKPNETEIRISTDARLVKSMFVEGMHEMELSRMTAMKFSINTIVGRIESRIKYLLSDINNKFKND